MAKVTAVSIFFIVICLVIIALVVYAVYSSLYRKRINKKLEDNESTAHVSMASTDSIGRIILIVCAVIFAISTLSMLSNISAGVQNTQNNLNNTINSLRYEITDLKEQLEEQNSVFVEFFLEYGEVDTENHTVEVAFDCIPRTVGEDTSIVLTVGNESVELKRSSDGRYKGTGWLPIFDPSCSNVYASVTTNDITTSHIVSNDSYNPLFMEFMGYFGGEMHIWEEEYEKGEYTLNAEYLKQAKGEINDVQLIFCINDSEIKRIDIVEHITEINESFDVNSPDESVVIYAEGTDRYGYIHRRAVSYLVNENDNFDFTEYAVMDKNRNILYSENG